MNSLKKSSKVSLDIMTTKIPCLLECAVPSPLKRIYEAYARFFWKFASGRGFGGEPDRRTTVYIRIHGDSRTASTPKSSAEVEFPKKPPQLTNFKKAVAFISLGLFFSGCTTTYNPFYDERSEKVAEQVKEYLKGFKPSETNVFKDKSTEKKILKDFQYV